MARALLLLGSNRAWVVHGADGLDEFSTTGYTKVSECRDGTVQTFYIHPSDYGLAKSSIEALRGGDAAQNAQRIREVLDGDSGPTAQYRAAERRRGIVHCRRASTRCERGSPKLPQRSIAGRRSPSCADLAETSQAGAAVMSSGRPRRPTCSRPSSRQPALGWPRSSEREPIAVLERRAAARTPNGAAFRAALADRSHTQRDRRVQAAFAIARRAPSRLRSRGHRAWLRERRRRGPLGADRADVLRRLARSPRAGARSCGRPAPAQGLHRRRLSAARGAGATAPTRFC